MNSRVLRRCLTATAIALQLPSAPTAQTTCRANTLGNQTCLRVQTMRPLPRPPETLKDSDPGDLFSAGTDAARDSPLVIPARSVDRLGTTLPGRQIEGSPQCRTDTLGNLVCR